MLFTRITSRQSTWGTTTVRTRVRFRRRSSKSARRLREVVGNHGVRTATLQFSAAPDVVAALVVGCRSEQQLIED